MSTTSLKSLINKYLQLQEEKRTNELKRIKKLLIYSVILVITLSIVTEYFLSMELGLLYGILALAYLGYSSIVRYKKYKTEYTDSFIRPLMKHLFPELEYFPKETVEREIFNDSEIFHGINVFKGEDLFMGHMKGTSIGFSEILAANSEKQKGSGKSSQPKYFLQGLFFYMKGNFNNYHPYYIRNLNTSISIHAHILNPLNFKKKIRLDHNEWVTQFEVFVDDENKPKPEVPIEIFVRLHRLEELLKSITVLAHITLSVKPHQISLALQPIKIFEPPILKKALDHQEKLECNLQIIEELIRLRNFFTD